MSTINYSSILSKVGTIIDNNGRGVTLVKKVNTATDSDKPWGQTTSSDTSVSATAVFTSYDSQEVDQDIVRRGDRKLYVKGDIGQSLDDFDQVVDGSDIWNIQSITTVNPGDTVMLYIMQVRL